METKNSDLRHEILTNELGNRMLDMVAPVYDRSRVALYLFQALGIVLQKQTDFIWNDFVKQVVPQTATWSIENWERQYGITPDASLSIEKRRQNILSAFQYKAPITPKKIKDRLEVLTGLEVSVQETGSNTIKVTIETYTPNFAAVNELLDKILPAHLLYTTNIADIVNSQPSEYYSLLVNEAEMVDVVVLN